MAKGIAEIRCGLCFLEDFHYIDKFGQQLEQQ